MHSHSSQDTFSIQNWPHYSGTFPGSWGCYSSFYMPPSYFQQMAALWINLQSLQTLGCGILYKVNPAIHLRLGLLLFLAFLSFPVSLVVLRNSQSTIASTESIQLLVKVTDLIWSVPHLCIFLVVLVIYKALLQNNVSDEMSHTPRSLFFIVQLLHLHLGIPCIPCTWEYHSIVWMILGLLYHGTFLHGVIFSSSSMPALLSNAKMQ